MHFDVKKCSFIFPPAKYLMAEDKLVITTEPKTDFWQKTYYGFINNNAHAFVMKTDEKYFSFTAKTSFEGKVLFDQCGIVVYQNAENWLKASMEVEDEKRQMLGSVVTNLGYSDWATSAYPSRDIHTVFYRLSRRESDYMLEYSFDGNVFMQMRIFHFFEGASYINMGVYACSPGASSFDATFEDFKMEKCLWKEHKA